MIDLFHEDAEVDDRLWPESDAGEADGSQLPPHGSYRRTAPPDSIIARVALHSMVFGNARAVSELWRRSVI